MGVGLFNHWLEFEDAPKNSTSQTPRFIYSEEKGRDNNPNPKNWEIIRYEEINGWLIVYIRYPDCINYEGYKILVYKNCTFDKLISQKYIDPHFSNEKLLFHPFARFEPTPEGWAMAVGFVLYATRCKKIEL